MSEREMFIASWEREFLTTVKVLRSYPNDKLDLKPSEKSKSARDLAWVFAMEQGMVDMAIKGKVDFSTPSPPAPTNIEEIITAFEQSVRKNIDRVKSMSDADYNSMMGWFVGPKTPGNVRKADVLWMTLMDMIHHRGQLSVYLRLAGAKVPSIYGPTADEPWM